MSFKNLKIKQKLVYSLGLVVLFVFSLMILYTYYTASKSQRELSYQLTDYISQKYAGQLSAELYRTQEISCTFE